MRKFYYFESDREGRYKRGRQSIEVVHTERGKVGVQFSHQGWYVGGQLTPEQAEEMADALRECAADARLDEEGAA